MAVDYRMVNTSDLVNAGGGMSNNSSGGSIGDYNKPFWYGDPASPNLYPQQGHTTDHTVPWNDWRKTLYPAKKWEYDNNHRWEHLKRMTEMYQERLKDNSESMTGSLNSTMIETDTEFLPDVKGFKEKTETTRSGSAYWLAIRNNPHFLAEISYFIRDKGYTAYKDGGKLWFFDKDHFQNTRSWVKINDSLLQLSLTNAPWRGKEEATFLEDVNLFEVGIFNSFDIEGEEQELELYYLCKNMMSFPIGHSPFLIDGGLFFEHEEHAVMLAGICNEVGNSETEEITFRTVLDKRFWVGEDS